MASLDDMDDDVVDVTAVDDDEPQVMAAAAPVAGAPVGRTSASPAPNSALKSGGMARMSGSSIEETEKLLSKLREYVESKGGEWEEGWHVEVFVRQTGNSAGTKDAYYFSPSGKRFRSRTEVVKAMGLGRPPVPSEEEAYAQAQAAFAGLSLPHKLDSGATITSWGAVDRREGFHTAVQIWPCAYKATFPDAQLEGAVYTSRIQADPEAEGPDFMVSLRTADGQEKLISSGSDPNDAWDKAAARQKAALEAALAREKALKPPSAKKPKAKPSGDAAQADGAATAAAPGSSSPSADAAAAGFGTAPAATAPPAAEQAANPAVAAPGAAPMANGIALTATAQQPAAGAGTQDAALTGEAAAAPSPPRDLGPTDKLLVTAAPLAGAWGEERFGFADGRVLQAIEGLPGAEGLEEYEFVARRNGGWEAEMRRLQKEGDRRARLASRGAKGVEKGKGQLAKQQEKRKRAEDKANAPKKSKKDTGGTLDSWLTAGGGGSDAGAGAGPLANMPPLLLPRAPLPPLILPPSADGQAARPAKKRKGLTAADRDVEAVMLRMLKQVETKCEREAAVAAKKAARDAEKAAAQALSAEEKRFAREVKRCEKLGLPPPSPMPKQQPKQLSTQAQPSKPVILPGTEDMLMPGAHKKPPQPEPLTKGVATPNALAAALAALELMVRFHKGLQLDTRRLPSPDQAEEALAMPAAHPQNCLALHAPLVEGVFYDIWSGATEVEAANNADVRVNDVSGAYPPFKEESWPEIVRRQFLLLELAAMVKALDSSGGLGPAVGGLGASPAHPLSLMDANTVLQTLLAGVHSRPDRHVAALPHTACTSAPAGLLATQDAAALAEAEEFMETVGNDGGANPDAAGRAALMRAGRRLLWTLINGQKCGKALCSQGVNAAIASRLAMPLDFRMVAARLETGAYGAGETGLEALGDDVDYICTLWRVGCTKGKAFARKQHDKRGSEGAANVAAALGVTVAAARREMKEAEAGADRQQEDGSTEPRKDAIVDDLFRPFVPWSACAGCWNSEDGKRIVICEGCEVEYHTYCLSPPLDEVPQGDWFCSRCKERGEAGEVVEDKPLAWRTPGAHDYIKLSELLGRVDYEDLSTDERGAVLAALEAAMLDTNFMRLTVADTLETRREAHQELNALRARLRNEEREREEELKRQREAAAAEAAAEAFARLESAAPKGSGKGKGGNKAAAVAAAGDAKADKPAGGKGKKQHKAAPEGQPAADAAGASAANGSAEPADDKSKPHARGTRSKGDALESMASEADVARMAALTAEIEELSERRAPLGWDRHWNRYWLLAGPRASAPRIRGPLICVELRPDPAKGSAMLSFASPQKQLQKQLPPDIAMAGAQWGCYPTPAALDALLDWLNPKGQREGPLRKKVAEQRRTLPSPKVQAERDAADAADAPKPIIVKLGGGKAANGRASASATPEPAAKPEPGAEAAPAAASAEPRTPVKAEPSTPAKAEPPAELAVQSAELAVQPQAAPAAAAGDSKAGPEAGEPPKILKLRKALQSLRNSLSDDVVDPVRGSAKRQAEWHRLVSKATSASEFMAAAVVLEHMVRREWLKPYWRLWSYPAPSPYDCETLAAVWLRVQGLQAAVKKSLAARDAAVLAPPKLPPGRRKLPPRGVASAHGTPASSEQEDDSDPEPARAQQGGRRVAASRFSEPARRSTRNTDAEDERAARELDEQLNGQLRGGVRPPPRTRGVDRGAPTGSRRANLRSASGTNSAANLQDAGGYRSRLRGVNGSGGQRPDYAYQAQIPSSDEDGDDDPVAEPAGANEASSDDGGSAALELDEQQSESDDDEQLDDAAAADDDDDVYEEYDEAAADGSDEVSSDDDDVEDEEDLRPAGRRSGRNAVPAPAAATRGRGTRSGGSHEDGKRGRQALPATAVVSGRQRLRKAA